MRVHAVVTDHAGNTLTSNLVSTTIDQNGPTIGITFPSSGGSYMRTGNAPGSWKRTSNDTCGAQRVCGTSSDAASGVASVEVKVTAPSGAVYNGTSFGGGDWVTVATTGGAWNLALANSAFPDNGTYTLEVRATDNAGNVTTTSRSFTLT